MHIPVDRSVSSCFARRHADFGKAKEAREPVVARTEVGPRERLSEAETWWEECATTALLAGGCTLGW